MDIKRSGSQPSGKGPAEYFTGTVRIDPLFHAPDPARAAGSYVTFEPGARSAWHTHPLGQTLIVTAGTGRVHRWGDPVEEIRPGDVVWMPPGEKHWHGASPETGMTHIAIQGEVSGKNVDWREGKKLEREINEKLVAIETQAGEYLVRIPLAELRERYQDYPKILSYFDAVRDHILKNLQRFKGTDAAPNLGQMTQIQMAEPPADPFLPYRVNVFVDNSDTQGSPIIIETNPAYHNLFGVVEKKPMVGGFITDFTLIKAGSISKANGGYLVLYDRDVFANPGVWEALQRVIKNRELRIEEPATFFGWMAPQGLRPEPIPTDTKIIMIGDPYLYRTLSAMDPDFRETFKVKADFDFEIDRSVENIVAFACFISDYCNRDGLRHFDSTGVARVVEHCARLVEDQNKLSTRFSDMVDLLIECDYWAGKENAELVSEKHVERAIVEKTFRLNLIEKRLQEMIGEGTVLVNVDGSVVGQVNGLAVYQMGDFSFGKPSRITAKTFLGRGGIVNIERESKLSGKTHDK